MNLDLNELGSNLQNTLAIIGTWVISSGLRILLVVILMVVAIKLTNVVSARLWGVFGGTDDDEARKRLETLRSLVRVALKITVFTISLTVILGELGIKIGPILAAAGVVGVAVGFGAQHLVQDVISGFFIFLEDQIRVGDVIEIAGKGGVVEGITLRMVVLRDLAGNVHYVRNGLIEVVTNMTKDYSRYVFDIGVAYREDVDEVFAVIREVDAELRADPAFAHHILEPIEILGLDQFADSAVIVKARTKTRPIKQWDVAREFNRRLKKAFDAAGIEMPYPHLTLYLGEDKAGSAPPLNVRLAEVAAEVKRRRASQDDA